MRVEVPHAWPADEGEALAIQDRLRPLVDERGPGSAAPRTVAGLDVAYAGDGRGTGDLVAAGVVVIDTATLTVVEQTTAVTTTSFPYVPGLFAFRELPVLIDALRTLTTTPDLLLCDGYGLAHPRRFGLASHLGVLTGLPSAGVAKTLFTGSYDPAALHLPRGSWAELTDGGETVGRALRTRTDVKPVFISTGHLIDLPTLTDLVLALAPAYRLPETTRQADHLSRTALAAASAPATRPPRSTG
ncbi:Endonuclease V [Streptomyces sp. DvalAA-14]|uniref:endonuclease V n=1 Tax=unclassified Streptomyces TaxID=2593676 RepID=UPI00081B7F7C|nr:MULTISPECIES: endonuclease V [unclassified Streptomyces]MYS20506.1 endonuclease V [Streptomyces sp. SID4948]SCD70642.1 Endonuclease V [Streptomyces sp. DvalAA-14]